MTDLGYLLLATGSAFVVSLAVTGMLVRRPGWLTVLDHPNERSLHRVPVPRTGGVGILAGMIVGAIVYDTHWQPHYLWAFLAISMIAVVSFLDDRFFIPPIFRLIVQVCAAGILLMYTDWVNGLIFPGGYWKWEESIGVVFSLLFLIWLTNLFNFMDGMDGLAGGMALFGFGAFAVLGFMAAAPLFTALSLTVAASATGFLLFNFPPARIFMGDTGSSTLGFIAGALALWADLAGLFPLWIGVLVFSPFVVDATVTLSRRLHQGEKIWIPHRSHYYQRLVQLGWGHRKTAVFEYVLMGLCTVSALYALRASPFLQWCIIGIWVVAYAGIAWIVRWLETAK